MSSVSSDEKLAEIMSPIVDGLFPAQHKGSTRVACLIYAYCLARVALNDVDGSNDTLAEKIWGLCRRRINKETSKAFVEAMIKEKYEIILPLNWRNNPEHKRMLYVYAFRLCRLNGLLEKSKKVKNKKKSKKDKNNPPASPPVTATLKTLNYAFSGYSFKESDITGIEEVIKNFSRTGI